MQFNLTSFVSDDKSGSCVFQMSILVFEEQDDQLVLGQSIFANYNVTLNHENDTIGFIWSPPAIQPDNNLEAFLGFFTIMGTSTLIAIILIYISLFRKKGG